MIHTWHYTSHKIRQSLVRLFANNYNTHLAPHPSFVSQYDRMYTMSSNGWRWVVEENTECFRHIQSSSRSLHDSEGHLFAQRKDIRAGWAHACISWCSPFCESDVNLVRSSPMTTLYARLTSDRMISHAASRKKIWVLHGGNPEGEESSRYTVKVRRDQASGWDALKFTSDLPRPSSPGPLFR